MLSKVYRSYSRDKMSDEDHLYGFSTDGEDSSDDEVVVEHGIDVGKLPTVAKDDTTVQKKLERAQKQQVRIPANFESSYTRSSHHRNTTRASSRSVVCRTVFTRISSERISRNSARYCVYVCPGIKRSILLSCCSFFLLNADFLDRQVETLCIPRV